MVLVLACRDQHIFNAFLPSESFVLLLRLASIKSNLWPDVLRGTTSVFKVFYAAYRGNDHIDFLKIFIKFLNISPMVFCIILTLSCFLSFHSSKPLQRKGVTE